MTNTLPPTGERYLPDAMAGDIELEHLHRYHVAAEVVAGLDVVDIACGEGYGSALLSRQCRSVVGVDISADAVAHARAKYPAHALEFRVGSCADIPVADASVDAVVSFETIEHHDQHEAMMREVKRILRPGGWLIVSSPDRHQYSDVPGYANPYHVKELYLPEFEALLRRWFAHVRLYGQRVHQASYVASLDTGSSTAETILNYLVAPNRIVRSAGSIDPVYFIAVASDSAALPSFPIGMFTTAAQSTRVVELEHSIHERSVQLDALHGHVAHMNGVLASRDESIDSLTRERDTIRIDHQTLQHRLGESEQNIHRLELDRARLLEHDEQQEARLNELSATLTEERVRSATQAHRIETLEHQLAEILRSRSWRAVNAMRKMIGRRRDPATGSNFPRDQFDIAYYLRTYPDVAASGADPYDHFVKHGLAEGRLPREQASPPALAAAESPAPKAMAPRPGPVAPSASAAAGKPGLLDDFDRDFYLANYPDVAQSGGDPYDHYVHHGRAEGRMAHAPRLEVGNPPPALRSERRTVLVVSHEASRTGAPILAWNICRHLRSQFNVVGLLLGGGDITPSFAADCDLLIGPFNRVPRGSGWIAALISELCTNYRIDFAIVNSMESRSVVQPLGLKFVPTVLVIHEFYAYSHPKDEFVSALAWAGAAVFPAQVVRDNALSMVTRHAVARAHIEPQGKSLIPAGDEAAPAADDGFDAIERVIDAARAASGSFVVLGAGTVQYRKGIDLFVAVASELQRLSPANDVTLIWIGHGFDPDRDLQYSAYLKQQIESARLRNLHLLDPTTRLEEIYDRVDAFLLPSRLDPLPNVAIDAMIHGLPVLCFENATGLAAILHGGNQSTDNVLPFGNVEAMARRLLAVREDAGLRDALATEARSIAATRFEMGPYVERLVGIASDLTPRMRQEQADVATLMTSDDFDASFHLPAASKLSRKSAIQAFVRTWHAGIGLRKALPGFDPWQYAELQGLGDSVENPTAHYIRAGRPAGPWRRALIDPSATAKEPELGRLRCALQIHAYYVDMLDGIVERLRLNRCACDLFVSVATDDAATLAADLLDGWPGKVEVKVFPNRGRDLGPLFTGYARALQDYDVIGHVHTKKSLALQGQGSVQNWSTFVHDWSEFLISNLLGRESGAMDAILARFAADPALGLVHPDDPHLVDWGDNLPIARSAGSRMNLDVLPPYPPSFPVGMMFWARPAALGALFGLNLDWNDYPKEPVPYDGTLLHALERLVPLAVERAGYSVAVVHTPGVQR